MEHPHPHPWWSTTGNWIRWKGVVGSSETARRKGVGSQLSKDVKGSGYPKRQLNLVNNQPSYQTITPCKSRTYICWFRKWTSSCIIQRESESQVQISSKIIQAQCFPAWTSKALTPIARKVLLPAVFPKMAHSIQSCQYVSDTWLHSKRPWKGVTFSRV